MRIYFLKSCLFWVVLVSTWVSTSHANDVQSEQHIEVSMRMIGHQVLLQANDSVSRVLPIQREGDNYVIGFAADFGIDPEAMAVTIDSVVTATQISQAYFVQIKTCDTDEVVYSYKVGGAENPDVVPCRTRPLPVDCYVLLVTLMDAPASTDNKSALAAGQTKTEKSSAALWLLPMMLVLGLIIYFVKNKRKVTRPHDQITIGEYRFDPKAMTLSFQTERIELTGKESELLYLLYTSVNSTVGREMILEKVWGDQGDYVGRTLDVFISKLRKKLEADSRIQIKNIRGVGYKLVMSAS